MLNQPTVAKEISDFQSALDFVCDLRNAGSKFSLDRIAKFAEAFGNPHLKYPVIHVAGTNGKGSVCASLASVLREAGYRTGSFFSPAVLFPHETVRIDGCPVPEETYLRLRGEVDAVAAEMKTVIRQRPDEKTGQPVNVDVEDCAQVRVRLVNGMEGLVEITRVASVLEQSSTFSVYGTAGSLHFTAAAPGRLRVYRQADARETCGAAPLGSAFAQHVAGLYPRTSLGWMTDAHMASQLHFYRSLLLEDEPVYRETPTIAEAALSQRVVEAGYRSAALDGKTVHMCDLPV